MHSFRDADGEPVAVCAEGRFTSTTSQELVKRGFMPLLSVRGRDSVELACIRSLVGGKQCAGRALEGRGASQAAPPIRPAANTVGMMSGKGSGVAAPRRDEGGFVSAERAAGRAAIVRPRDRSGPCCLMAESSEPPTDEVRRPGMRNRRRRRTNPSEASPADESAAAGNGPRISRLIGRLACRGGFPRGRIGSRIGRAAGRLGSSRRRNSAAAETELDPELAALLGEAPSAAALTMQRRRRSSTRARRVAGGVFASRRCAPEDAPAAELDPELADLLGDSPPAADSGEGSAPELDPDLAALLGEAPSEPSDEPPSDEPPAAELSSGEPPSDEPTAEDSSADAAELDPELRRCSARTPS